MNREILFRGKRIDNGEWVYGYLWSNHTIGCESPCGNVDEIVVDPSTVGQYTGLTDRNGTKIFEEDIISIKNGFGEICRFKIFYGQCGGVQNVKHSVGYMGFYFASADDETRKCMEFGARNDPAYYLNTYDCEIIGNIHDGKDSQHD